MSSNTIFLDTGSNFSSLLFFVWHIAFKIYVLKYWIHQNRQTMASHFFLSKIEDLNNFVTEQVRNNATKNILTHLQIYTKSSVHESQSQLGSFFFHIHTSNSVHLTTDPRKQRASRRTYIMLTAILQLR